MCSLKYCGILTIYTLYRFAKFILPTCMLLALNFEWVQGKVNINNLRSLRSKSDSFAKRSLSHLLSQFWTVPSSIHFHHIYSHTHTHTLSLSHTNIVFFCHFKFVQAVAENCFIFVSAIMMIAPKYCNSDQN